MEWKYIDSPNSLPPTNEKVWLSIANYDYPVIGMLLHVSGGILDIVWHITAHYELQERLIQYQGPNDKMAPYAWCSLNETPTDIAPRPAGLEYKGLMALTIDEWQRPKKPKPTLIIPKE